MKPPDCGIAFVLANGGKLPRCTSQLDHRRCVKHSGHEGRHQHRDTKWRSLEAQKPAPRVVYPGGQIGTVPLFNKTNIDFVEAENVKAPRVVAECWTCRERVGSQVTSIPMNTSKFETRPDLTFKQADTHRALGHDVRPVREEVKP